MFLFLNCEARLPKAADFAKYKINAGTEIAHARSWPPREPAASE